MRKYIDINLGQKSVTNRELHGREIAECGRYLIAKMLLEQNIAGVEGCLETLRLEAAFNNAAGFDEEDDELPSFFLDEPLPPTDKMARLRSSEVNAAMQNLLDAHSG